MKGVGRLLAGFQVILLTAVCAGVALADENKHVRTHLESMSDAVSSLSYRGTFIQVQDGDVETLEVIHRGNDKGSRERLMTLSGHVRELIRNQDKVKCVHARDGEGEVDLRQSASRFHAHLGKQLDQLDENYYRLVSLGEDRVAGRDVRILGIRPQDEHRYGFRFWLDRENDMPLRSDMIDPEGEVIQKVMFTEIRFLDEVPDDALEGQLSEDDERYTTRRATYSGAALDMDDETPGWELEELPAGFRLVSVREEESRDKERLHHLIVSDGLARISIFVEPGSEQRRPFEGRSRMGTMSAFGRVVDEHQLTVVGEAPPDTVMAIARALDGLPEKLRSGEAEH